MSNKRKPMATKIPSQRSSRRQHCRFIFYNLLQFQKPILLQFPKLCSTNRQALCSPNVWINLTQKKSLKYLIQSAISTYFIAISASSKVYENGGLFDRLRLKYTYRAPENIPFPQSFFEVVCYKQPISTMTLFLQMSKGNNDLSVNQTSLASKNLNTYWWHYPKQRKNLQHEISCQKTITDDPRLNKRKLPMFFLY